MEKTPVYPKGPVRLIAEMLGVYPSIITNAKENNHYKRWYKKKNSGKGYRPIDEPYEDLARAQFLIYQKLLMKIYKRDDLYNEAIFGGVLGRSPKQNAMYHAMGSPKLFFYRFDFKSAFPSVKREHVFSFWKKLLLDEVDLYRKQYRYYKEVLAPLRARSLKRKPNGSRSRELEEHQKRWKKYYELRSEAKKTSNWTNYHQYKTKLFASPKNLKILRKYKKEGVKSWWDVYNKYPLIPNRTSKWFRKLVTDGNNLLVEDIVDRTAKLLSELTSMEGNKGMAQGATTSMMMLNLIVSKEKILPKIRKFFSEKYPTVPTKVSIYVDDITISTNKRLSLEDEMEIVRIVENVGIFKIAKEKTLRFDRVSHSPVVTGYRIVTKNLPFQEVEWMMKDGTKSERKAVKNCLEKKRPWKVDKVTVPKARLKKARGMIRRALESPVDDPIHQRLLGYMNWVFTGRKESELPGYVKNIWDVYKNIFMPKPEVPEKPKCYIYDDEADDCGPFD